MSTIRDIAKAASVSVATVSHVVNNTRYVSPELRKRVEDAIAAADVPPNFVLRRKAKETRESAEHAPYFLLLASDFHNNFTENLVYCLKSLLEKENAGLICLEVNNTIQIELMEHLMEDSLQPKGIFLSVSVAGEELSSFLKTQTCPIVAIGNSIPSVRCDRVCSANADGAYLATTHLIRSGHENIAILCESEDSEANQDRILGYKKALKENQISVREGYIINNLDTRQATYHTLDTLLAHKDRPSAIFLASYDIIRWTYKYIHELNISCPQDLSVVGFNDFSWAPLLNPPVTTVQQNVSEMCQKAVDFMMERVHSRFAHSASQQAQIPTTLCVRSSTCGIGRGPFGEKASDISAVELPEEDYIKCRSEKYTAVISFHYSGRSWSLLQEQGIRSIFEKAGISLIAVTDAHFDPDLQARQLQSFQLLEPDILISIPTDTRKTADAYRSFLPTKTRLVFLSNIPDSFSRSDYVSCVSVNERSHGRNIGRGIGEYMRKNSLKNLGIIRHNLTDFYATKQRDMSGIQVLTEEYPELSIRGTTSFAKEEDAYSATKQLMADHPEIEGLYVSWEGPTRYVLKALSDIGRNDVAVSTGDLEYNIALNMAKGGMIKAISAQCPYDQGRAAALCAVNALLGRTAPSFIGVEPMYVDNSNLVKAWQQVYKAPLPQEINTSLNWTYANSDN